MDIQEYISLVDEAYNNLGVKELEERIIELTEQSRTEEGEESPVYASMLSELASFYRGLLQFEKSEDSYVKALAILEKVFGRDNPDYATTLNNLAGTHRLAKQREKALEEFDTALGIYKNTVGESHVLYASALNNKSLVYLDSGELDKAVPLLEQASAILAMQPDKLDELASSLCNLGALYMRLGQLEEAESSLKRAINMFETVLGPMTSHYFAALNTLGMVYLYEKRYSEAADSFQAAAENAKMLFGEEHPQYKSTLRHLETARKAAENERT